MRNFILVLAFILFSGVAFAQKRSDLKGPKYKNFKIWKSNALPTVLFVGSDNLDLKGPEFKNHKPWKKQQDKSEKIIATKSTRPKVTGPKFKNYKPWKNSH